ncbi:heme-dependent catalase, partial [Exidia glandulosa HHB12029]
SPTPVEQFLGAHPAALAFVTTPKPHPLSFGTESFFALNAFKFISASGASRFGRYTWVPKAGVQHFDEAGAASLGADYLFDELVTRLGSGPVEYELWLQLAEDGDVTDNVTVKWPAERERVLLGTVSLDKIAEDGAQAAKHIIFDPIPRVQGVEASADPILEMRAAVYLISGKKRRAAPALEA